MTPFPPSADEKRRVLLVDDDVELAQMLCEYLEPDNYVVSLAHTGARARELLAQQDFDIALLDLMLPDANGLDLLRRYRGASHKPVIMFTAHGSETDRVLGLELGADDYLAKPFSPRELKARIHAVLRRFSAADSQARQPGLLTAGTLSMDPASGRTRLGETAVELTGAEQRILELLLRSLGQIVSRERIGLYALGRAPGPYDRSVETHISSLRKKLELTADDAPLTLRNVRGQGYVLACPSVP